MEFEKWLQSRLTAHGFPCGPIDGEIGSKTVAALKAFQFARSLKQTGTADDATITELRKTSSAIPADVKGQLPDRDNAPEKETFQPSRRIWPRQAEVPSFYGTVGTNQISIEVPFDMYLAWDKGTRVRKMTLHKLVADSALKVFLSIAKSYSPEERKSLGIDLFGGSLNVRKMRGGSNYSMHSWGIAIDFDPERNQLKWGRDKARLAQPDAVPFWVAWESEGWLALGRARNFDWMHVQAARL